jgi:uncharacterized protein YjbJ (UPF0337 family)
MEAKMGEIIDKVKGRVKRAAGALTGDKEMENEGKVDEAKGKAKGAVEELKYAIKHRNEPPRKETPPRNETPRRA